MRLKVSSKDIFPEYLTLAINSPLIQKQIERDAGGTIISHWLVDQVKHVIVPTPSKDKQKKMVEKIRQSFELRDKSENTFLKATTAIQNAIERGEAYATKELK